MIYHQIRFSMKPDVPPDELEASLERLRDAGPRARCRPVLGRWP
jgi:hypothetical protein